MQPNIISDENIYESTWELDLSSKIKKINVKTDVCVQIGKDKMESILETIDIEPSKTEITCLRDTSSDEICQLCKHWLSGWKYLGEITDKIWLGNELVNQSMSHLFNIMSISLGESIFKNDQLENMQVQITFLEDLLSNYSSSITDNF